MSDATAAGRVQSKSGIGELTLAARSAPSCLASTRTWVTANGLDFCFGAASPLLWALGHSFVGIEGDARIYMGRALADLDPAGVGRDLMFVMDGQSSFSLFRVVARVLAETVGFGPSVALLTMANLVCWFGAAAIFVRAIVPGRATALVLAVVCILPRLYTPWNLLAAGEALPVPRPLAEAGVLLALAALCHGRFVLCAAALAAAAAFHPIMAAAGFGVVLIVLGLRDRRWFAGAALLGLAAVCAGLLGVPILSRLAVVVDAPWRDLLTARNPYLFLHLWPREAMGLVVIQAVTILIAAVWLPPRVRMIFGASVAVALLGCAASLLLGDLLANQLIIQAQLWRALWLPAVLAPVAAGICLWRLPTSGAAGQIALAGLSLSWIASDMIPLAPLAALGAAAALFGIPRLSVPIGRPVVIAAWIACAPLAAVSEVDALSVLRTIVSSMPSAVDTIWHTLWLLKIPAVPLAAAAYAAWRWPGLLSVRVGAPALLAGGLFLMTVSWDTRTPAHADADAALVKPELVQLLASRPGEVLWLDGDDSWYWARRANWVGPTQGGGLVFSRDLATKWHKRTLALIEAGLGTSWMLHPWRDPISWSAVPLDVAKVATFCRRADAPAWIVASLAPGVTPPVELSPSLWTPRLAHVKMYIGFEEVHWRHFDRYAVIPCGSA